MVSCFSYLFHEAQGGIECIKEEKRRLFLLPELNQA